MARQNPWTTTAVGMPLAGPSMPPCPTRSIPACHWVRIRVTVTDTVVRSMPSCHVRAKVRAREQKGSLPAIRVKFRVRKYVSLQLGLELSFFGLGVRRNCAVGHTHKNAVAKGP